MTTNNQLELLPPRTKKRAPVPAMALNAEQQDAIATGAGAYALLAAPGSGKTEVTVQRYCRLVREGESPGDILSLSFTSESAKEMRKRADLRLGTSVPDSGTGRPSGFLTMHSLALSFATLERDHFDFPLAHFPLALPNQRASPGHAETGRACVIRLNTPRDFRRTHFRGAIFWNGSGSTLEGCRQGESRVRPTCFQ